MLASSSRKIINISLLYRWRRKRPVDEIKIEAYEAGRVINPNTFRVKCQVRGWGVQIVPDAKSNEVV
jgi:hypothetical protein